MNFWTISSEFLSDSVASALLSSHIYWATFCRAIDGNTVELVVDLGFCTRVHWRFPIVGLDKCPTQGETAAQAQVLRQAMTDLLSPAKEIYVHSVREDNTPSPFPMATTYYGDITYFVDGTWYNLTQEITDARQ